MSPRLSAGAVRARRGVREFPRALNALEVIDRVRRRLMRLRRLALGLLVLTSLAVAGLATRWPGSRSGRAR